MPLELTEKDSCFICPFLVEYAAKIRFNFMSQLLAGTIYITYSAAAMNKKHKDIRAYFCENNS